MPTVQVKPSGVIFDVRDGETIIQAAWRNGYWWPTVCEGQGTCKACVLRVDAGEENTSPIDSWEREGLDEIGPTLPGGGDGFRLACQIRIAGDDTVHKIGVREGAR
jgi:ferredoxin, 2Fe-2S